MAKTPKKPAVGNFKRPGWIADAKFMKDFVQVNEANMPSAKVLGRVFYCFKPEVKGYKYTGFIEIYPQLKRCMMKTSNHPILPTHDTFVTGDMSREEYVDHFKPLLAQALAKKILYIKLNDKLVRYERT